MKTKFLIQTLLSSMTSTFIFIFLVFLLELLIQTERKDIMGLQFTSAIMIAAESQHFCGEVFFFSLNITIIMMCSLLPLSLYKTVTNAWPNWFSEMGCAAITPPMDIGQRDSPLPWTGFISKEVMSKFRYAVMIKFKNTNATYRKTLLPACTNRNFEDIVQIIPEMFTTILTLTFICTTNLLI